MKNKKIFGIAGLMSIVLLIAGGIVLAAQGTLPQSTGKAPATIQNLSDTAPAKGKSRCDNLGSAALRNYTTSGYVGIKATAFNRNTGTATVVTWSEDGTSAWVGSDYRIVNDKGAAISKVTATAFGNNTSVRACIQRQ